MPGRYVHVPSINIRHGGVMRFFNMSNDGNSRKDIFIIKKRGIKNKFRVRESAKDKGSVKANRDRDRVVIRKSVGRNHHQIIMFIQHHQEEIFIKIEVI